MKLLLIATLISTALAVPPHQRTRAEYNIEEKYEPISVGPANIDKNEPISVEPAIVDQPISVGPAIVDHYEPISVGPAIVDQPISVGPAIVDNYKPISVGPAIVDKYEPISVNPAIIDDKDVLVDQNIVDTVINEIMDKPEITPALGSGSNIQIVQKITQYIISPVITVLSNKN